MSKTLRRLSLAAAAIPAVLIFGVGSPAQAAEIAPIAKEVDDLVAAVSDALAATIYPLLGALGI